jgi:hypothetical protein
LEQPGLEQQRRGCGCWPRGPSGWWLAYLDDHKGLAIAVHEVTPEGNVSGSIITDGYPEMSLTTKNCKLRDVLGLSYISQGLRYRSKGCSVELGKVGQTYDYKGLYPYRIRILKIELNPTTIKNQVTFQIEQISEASQTASQVLSEPQQAQEEKFKKNATGDRRERQKSARANGRGRQKDARGDRRDD